MNEIDWYGGNSDDSPDELLDPEEEIFQYISDMVATYPQEIANKLGHSLRTVQHHLRVMFNSNRIGILEIRFDKVPGRIRYRLSSLREEGLSGVDIRKRTWYCIMEAGNELETRLFSEQGLIFRRVMIGLEGGDHE